MSFVRQRLIDPNAEGGVKFESAQRTGLTDDELRGLREEMEKRMNVQQALVGRQHMPQQAVSNAFGQRDMLSANMLNIRTPNTGLDQLQPFPAGLAPTNPLIANVSHDLQMTGESIRNMALQIPPENQKQMMQQERGFYRGVTQDFHNNYLHIVNQRQRERDLYSFV